MWVLPVYAVPLADFLRRVDVRGPVHLPGFLRSIQHLQYDSNAIRQFLAVQGIEAVIPPKANRTEAIHHDAQKYKLREKIERFFNKLKQFRRIATRYDKLSRTFLAFVHIVSAWIMLR